MMPTVAMIFGAILSTLGLVAYSAPDLLGPDPAHITALAPALIGVPIAALGLLSLLQPSMLKHAMHLAAMLGLAGLVGGFMPVVLRSFDTDKAAVKVGIAMTLVSAVFVGFCVKSFIDAKKARKAREAAAV